MIDSKLSQGRSRGAVSAVLFVLLLSGMVNATLFVFLLYLNRGAEVSIPEADTPLEVSVSPRIPSPRPTRTTEPEEPRELLPPQEVQVELDFSAPKSEPLDLTTPPLNFTVLPPTDLSVPMMVPARTIEVAEVRPAVPMAMDSVDTPPRNVHVPEPTYPRAMLRRGREGEVTIRFLINTDGAVEIVSVVNSKGGRTFERSVEKVVKRWRFTPAQHQGDVVPVWGVKTIYFKRER